MVFAVPSELPSHSWRVLPPKAAQSGLLTSAPTEAGLVHVWTSLHIPQSWALVYKSILLSEAEGLVSPELLVAIFCGNLTHSHLSLLLLLLFVFFFS